MEKLKIVKARALINVHIIVLAIISVTVVLTYCNKILKIQRSFFSLVQNKQRFTKDEGKHGTYASELIKNLTPM